MGLVMDYLLETIPFIFISMPFVLVHRVLEIKKRQYKGIKTTTHREIGAIILMFSLIFIGILTIGRGVYFLNSKFISQHIHESLMSMNYIPFVKMLSDLVRSIFTASIGGIVNFFGNIFMFMPFGFCIALLSKKDKRTKYTLLAGAGVSLLIEITQFFIIRGTDIDDIILNALGAFLGLKLLNFVEKRYPDFIDKFHINDTEGELAAKEKRNVHIITILQIAVWIIMIINLKKMVMFFHGNIK